MFLLLLAIQQPSPCPANGFGPGVECRVLMVAENPEQPQGRKIPIRYALVRATGPDKRPEAVFLFSGGPGAASTEMTGLATGLLAPIRAVRDIVMVDQRGTGGSHPLMCPAELRKYPERAFGTMFPPAAIADCRDKLGRIADLTRYTTDYAIGDIELVRQALGYPKIILWGGSYGTRIEQAYARQFPDRVQAMVLDGVVPFDFSLPLSYAATLQESIDNLLAGCRARAGCRDSFPDLDRQWTSLVARFKQQSVPVTLTSKWWPPVEVQMSLGDFGYAVRGVLYRTDLSRQLPARIAEAATSGNLDWFAGRYYSRAADFEEDFADGLHLAAVCNEETVWIRDPDVGPATMTSFIGTYLIDQYREACRGWPRARVDSSFRRPLTAPIPTLLVSGLFDPVTPPRIAERVARSLPVSRHIVDSTGHHGSSFGCARPAVMHVLREGTLDGVPDVCNRPPWTVSLTFDDLPLTGAASCPPARIREINSALLATLRQANAPAAAFAIPGTPCQGDGPSSASEIIGMWLRAGHTVGSHSFSHRDYNAASVSEYAADLARADSVLEPLLQAAGQRRRWFRPPLLHTGPDSVRRVALDEWLEAKRYRMGVVTIDNQEWVYASAYSRAQAAGHLDVARAIAGAYLEHLDESARYYRSRAVRLFGRDIPQVLLLHVNQLNADLLPRVLDRLRASGARFISLDSATSDPAYRTPDRYVGPRGLSWLHRWAAGSAGSPAVDEPREARWVAEYAASGVRP